MNLHEAQKAIEKAMGDLRSRRREAHSRAKVALQKTLGPIARLADLRQVLRSDFPEGSDRKEFIGCLEEAEHAEFQIFELQELWEDIIKEFFPNHKGVKITLKVTKDCPLNLVKGLSDRLTKLLTTD